ncbi:hypothetical protein ACFO5R_16890 [Halosolutus amylolyticus]|uniref:Uncharacterized protein n=1 Tax=Halosolutus amylolyticus TaxID=2932267 RepID=A0ABD5PSV6_9EURY|nr:hypothetical protein [Halosolutus amylolyticus]
MKSRVYRATLFALYQLCIAIGIVALPLAIATRQVGFTLPLHRLIETVGAAHEAAQPQMN